MRHGPHVLKKVLVRPFLKNKVEDKSLWQVEQLFIAVLEDIFINGNLSFIHNQAVNSYIKI